MGEAFDNHLADELVKARPGGAQAAAFGVGGVRLWMEFVPGVSARDVADPWFGDRNGFDETLDLVEAGAERIVEAVRDSR